MNLLAESLGFLLQPWHLVAYLQPLSADVSLVLPGGSQTVPHWCSPTWPSPGPQVAGPCDPPPHRAKSPAARGSAASLTPVGAFLWAYAQNYRVPSQALQTSPIKPSL